MQQQIMEPEALRSRPDLAGAGGGGRRVVEPPPATPPHGDDGSAAIFFDDVLFHNRMVSAAHQQARRDMATQTEETILAPELGDGHRVVERPPELCSGTTPAAAVARLEVRRHAGGGAAVRCAICIEDFEAGEGLSVMPCSHSFHEGCIAKWLARSHLCPYCRHALPD